MAIDWGQFRCLEPLSRHFGFDRGTPVERYYTDKFLQRHADKVRGRALEFMDARYTRKFGLGKVSESWVLGLEKSPETTVLADITRENGLPDEHFDCVIATFVLDVIQDLKAAVATLRRILKPGGTLLVACDQIAHTNREVERIWGKKWAFTARSLRSCLLESFHEVETESYGNLLAATAFLWGVTAEELTPAELDHFDPDYATVVCARAL